MIGRARVVNAGSLAMPFGATGANWLCSGAASSSAALRTIWTRQQRASAPLIFGDAQNVADAGLVPAALGYADAGAIHHRHVQMRAGRRSEWPCARVDVRVAISRRLAGRE